MDLSDNISINLILNLHHMNKIVSFCLVASLLSLTISVNLQQ